MISVQNLRQQLSGNKIFILIVFIFIGLSSCSSTKEVSRSGSKTRTSRTKTKKQRTKPRPAKVDTVQWKTDTGNNAEDDLTSNSGYIFKDSYDISLFIPFNAKSAEASDVSDKSNKYNSYLNFYGGVKMALNELEDDGYNLSIEIRDSESSKFKENMRTAVESTDIIIGPYDLDDIKFAANLAKKNETLLISPWKATSKINANPYYLQLLPSLYDHFDKMVEHSTANYNMENVFIVGRKSVSKDRSIINYFQEANFRINGDDADPIREIYIEIDSLINGEDVFGKLLVENEQNVFLFPHYSNKDEAYLRDVLRRLNVDKGINSVVSYVMPMAYNSDIINYDFYNSLRMRVIRSHYVDPTDRRVQQFKRDFFDIYGATPTEEAYKGYDMMHFIAKSLKKYGTEFQFHVKRDKNDYLQTNYHIGAKYDETKGGDIPSVQYFMNSHLDVLKFSNNRFNRK